MDSKSWSKAAEDNFHRPGGVRRSFMPVRKAMSGIFRSSDRVASSSSSSSSAGSSLNQSPQSTITDGSDETDVLESQSKRRKRISFRRSFGSPLLSPTSISSADAVPTDYFGSKSTINRHSRRTSGLNGRCLLPYGEAFSNAKVEEEEEEEERSEPPKRPSCPAPILNLSPDDCQLMEYEGYYAQYLSLQYAHLLKRVTQYPSDESFYCKGLEDDTPYGRLSPDRGIEDDTSKKGFRDSFLSLLAPNALKLRPQSTFFSFESPPSSYSGGSECSMETASQGLGNQEEAISENNLALTNNDFDVTLFCPSSPKSIIRLQLILPPSASFDRTLNLRMESNASVLELKESLCSTLYRLHNYSISPASIALFLAYHEKEQLKRLDNDLPLYQEGVQDDDEILVRF